MKRLLSLVVILGFTHFLTINSSFCQNQTELWGMTSGGGTNDNGVMFNYDINTSTYVKKLDFNDSVSGSSPHGSLMQATNGKLYGITYSGGSNDYGVLFEYDPVTSSFSKKFNFDFEISGGYSSGSLIQAFNGKLYGMNHGGISGTGFIFEFDPLTASYINKFEFNSPTTGDNPYGSLIQIPNGKMYGMTSGGGVYSSGTLFEFDPATSTFIKKLDFNASTTGNYPSGSLILADNGKLYGMTLFGGASGYGALFEYDPTTSTFTKKYDFAGTNGYSPYGSLIQATNGKLYGLTESGGINGSGVLFEFDITTSTYIKKFDFDGAINGKIPMGSLVQAANGKLYGMTKEGGLNNFGVLFEYDPVSNTFNKKMDFNNTNGKYPEYNSLIEICKLPKLTASIPDVTICSNMNANFTTKASGNNLSYQWQLNIGSGFFDLTENSFYSDVTDDTLHLIGTTTDMNGYQFRCSITSTCPIYTLYSDTATLTVNSTVTSTTNLAICPAELPYFWNGLVCGAAGSYIATLVSSKGCDSLATLNLTVNPTMTSTTNIAICSGLLPYTWNGLTFPAAGSQTSTLISSKGCDSLATLNLTVNSTVTSTTNIAISSTELPYLWNGLTFLTTGSQTATLVSSTGCDSLVTLNLTVNGQFVQIDRILVDACNEASGNEGENEMVLFHVESLPVNVSDIRVDGASGTGVFETSKWPSTANTFLGWIVPGTAAYDSASTKVAIINAGIANCGKLIIPTGGPNNQGIIPAGKKGLIITSSKFSTTAHDFSTLTDTLYVVIQNPGNVSGHFPNYTSITTSKFRSLRLHKIIADTIQINEDVTFDRNLLTDLSGAQTSADGASVRYTENGTATYYNNGCQAPYIPLNPAWNSTSVCQSAAAINLNALLDENATTGGVWTGIGVSGNTFTPSGLSGYYSVTYTVESSSCVMVETHAIQVIPNEGSTTNMTLCPLELPYMWNGLTFLVAGSQTATLVSSKGCDSLATLNLTVTTPPTTPVFTILDSICTGATPPILPTISNNGITGTWSPSVVSNTATGSYTFTPTAGQCANNTTITVVVRVNHVPTVAEMNVSSNSPVCVGTTLNLYASGGVNYAWSGPNAYATVIQNIVIPNAQVHFSGNYIVTVTTAEGCSSTATAIVVVNPLPTPAAFNNGPLCEGSTLNLTATGGLNYAWSGPNGFSSILQNPTITNITTANSGNYTVTVSNSGGCNSSTQTNVVINPSVSSTTDIAICSSALPYIWNGLTFATAGSQTATLTSVWGCDSIATLNLTINPTSTSNNPVSICMGDSYVFNGHTYTTTGIYNDTLQTIHGCDSIVTTNLTVNTSSITGSVVYSGGTLNAGTASVILFNEDVSGNFQQIDSVIVGSNGSFAFQNMPDGDYHLYVNLTDNLTYPELFNTYFDSTIGWQNAAVLTLNCNTDTNVIIHMIETDPASPGNGHITGTIQQYTNNKTIGDPLPGVEIYVKSESNNEPVANCASKSNGVYDFTRIPNGSYSIYVDIPGIPMIQTYTGINVTASDTLFENLNFYVDTTTLSAGIYTDEILSVSKIETPELSVIIFPNPVKNELSIEVSNQTEGLSIEVLDINGKSLYKSTTGNRAKIEMNAFSTGVYLIKIQSKNTVIFKKIIKE